MKEREMVFHNVDQVRETTLPDNLGKIFQAMASIICNLSADHKVKSQSKEKRTSEGEVVVRGNSVERDRSFSWSIRRQRWKRWLKEWPNFTQNAVKYRLKIHCSRWSGKLQTRKEGRKEGDRRRDLEKPIKPNEPSAHYKPSNWADRRWIRFSDRPEPNGIMYKVWKHYEGSRDTKERRASLLTDDWWLRVCSALKKTTAAIKIGFIYLHSYRSVLIFAVMTLSVHF